MPQIELTDCTYVYQPGTVNAQTAVDKINLQIEPGELLAIIGRGGSGKSTLSLMLSGLYPPTSGCVRVDGAVAEPGKIFRQVGLVFQYPEQQLFSDTIYNEIAFGARNFGASEDELPAKVREALTAVDLDPEIYSERSPFALSGGQKRRVCIACLLAIDPSVVIFDEPTAGLDPEGRAWIKQLIVDLHETGHTVIWVSHDMAEVSEVADRVIVMRKGKIVMDGSPADVFSDTDRLADAGLEAPVAAMVINDLKKAGVPLKGKAVTVRAAAEEIEEYLEGSSHV